MLFGYELSPKNMVAVALGLTAILGTVVMYNNAHPIVEPYAPALRGYVRESASETAAKAVKPIETWRSTWETDYGQFKVLQSTETARLILVQLRQNLISAKKELEANPGSQIVKDQITQLENEVKRTSTRIQDYEASLLKK